MLRMRYAPLVAVVFLPKSTDEMCKPISNHKEHGARLRSVLEKALWDNAHVDIKSDVERKFHLSHTAPAADKSPELVRKVQSNRLPKPIVDPRCCLWSGFAGYSRTGQLLFCTQDSPPKLLVCLMVFYG